jgi:hypothetical protein
LDAVNGNDVNGRYEWLLARVHRECDLNGALLFPSILPEMFTWIVGMEFQNGQNQAILGVSK